MEHKSNIFCFKNLVEDRKRPKGLGTNLTLYAIHVSLNSACKVNFYPKNPIFPQFYCNTENNVPLGKEGYGGKINNVKPFLEVKYY